MVAMELAAAGERLADLVEMAESGERVCLTKDGAPVARILALEKSAGEVRAVGTRRHPE